MEKLNFLLACRQIFLLYIGLYWVTIGLGISHHNAAPRVSGAWDPGARQGGIRALKVRVALGAEGSGFWFALKVRVASGAEGSGFWFALKVRVALGAEGSGFWFLVLGLR